MADVAQGIDPAVLREAAQWLVRLNDSEAGPTDHDALQRWLDSSPQHAQAWRRAESLLSDIDRAGNAPGDIARATLGRPPSASRRAALSRLAKFAWLPLVPTTALLTWRHAPWQEWSADYRTATGEQRRLTLADGSEVVLNTASALDVRFSAGIRLLRLLAGEIRVVSAPDRGGSRPLVVETAEGRVRAIGTRFTVRRDRGKPFSHVAVFDGAVEIVAGLQTLQLARQQQAGFDAAGIAAARSADESLDGAWVSGMLIAQGMRLADLCAELDRYRPGWLRCHPDVASLRVSGAFPVLDAERSLRLLAATFPVRVRRFGRWWTSIEPATA